MYRVQIAPGVFLDSVGGPKTVVACTEDWATYFTSAHAAHIAAKALREKGFPWAEVQAARWEPVAAPLEPIAGA